MIDCYIFVNLLLTTALLCKFGAYGPQAARRVFQRPTIPLVYVSQNKTKSKTHQWGVGFGKKIILIDQIGSAWSLLTLNHFLISDYGLLRIPHLRMTFSPQVAVHMALSVIRFTRGVFLN